jgi:hypothetical protein
VEAPYRGPTIGGDSDKGAGMHAFGNVRVHSPSHAGFVAFAFFQFAACYDAHLPSVTVRDENAGRAHTASTLQLSHSSQTNGVAGVG